NYSVFPLKSGEQLLYIDILPFGLRNNKQLSGCKAKHSGKDTCRKDLNTVVEIGNCSVVSTPCCGNLRFYLSKVALQIHEVLVSLKLRISLHRNHQVANAGRQLVIEIHLFILAEIARNGLCTKFSNLGQQFLLMPGIFLNGGNKIWNQVVALFKLGI